MRNVILWAGERFPLRNMVFFGLLYAAGVFASRAMTRTGTLTIAWQDVGGLLAVVAFFLTLRVLDEHKDYANDCLTHPGRVLQRGLVSLANLRVLGVVALAVQVAFVLISDRGLGTLSRSWLLVGAWTTLMAVEFFVADWLRPRLLLYAALHLAVMPLLLWWIALIGARGAPLPSAVWLLLALGYSTAAAFEMARKLHAPEDERPGVDSYSKTLGTNLAARVLMVDIMVTAGLAALVVWNLCGATMAGIAMLCSSAGALPGLTSLARFGAKPAGALADHAERGTAFALLAAYVTLIAMVVIERGIRWA
jgi:4-hydroxybenzoate polyprenyltransferase